ncbi:TonB-dependent receptor, FCYXU motif-type [Desulfonema magnum]|uniref:TonB-dependent receptor-like superfamily protein n=1 Tax=Desulfonema magnum TaxID=45655 RepID=A0A975BWT9_9BACT|nr:TonB-dependent receptor [Desulfonema magnum]QTA92559.1 TonB-dependent receptor-like superfamily protein [Desulfonema magnum]
MKEVWKKQNRIIIKVFAGLCLFLTGMAGAEEKKVQRLDEVVVTADRMDEDVTHTPEKTTIDVETYQTVGTPQNICDIIRNQPVIDFRGATDLVPGDLVDGDDTIFMRGFGSNRFDTAMDGSTLRKSGGRNTYHIVDYSLLPPFLIEKVEILPGPHSALYPGKSIGGVVNLVTKAPQKYDTSKPDMALSASFKSYDTHNHSISLQGGAGNFIYDAGFQKYATDGYLRNAASDIDTVFGRIGYILSSDGYLTLTTSHTRAEREIPIRNDPDANYDDGHPVVKTSSYEEWQKPEWDESASSYRFTYHQPSPIGIWDLNAYYSEENWEKIYFRKNSQGIYDASWETEWYQQGGKLQDEIRFSDNHVMTIGADLGQYFDGDGRTDQKRIEIMSGFVQHRWRIIPRLTLTAGIRYEDVSIWVDNTKSNGDIYISGRPEWIERSWGEWSPKSFLTYELDDIAAGLRDTSVSLGISRIWKAPDWHGDYNPRGMPAGAWTEPEHGIGCDLVLSRRVSDDIQLKANYAYYEIKDYIAHNWDYAKYTPGSGNSVPPGMEYKDWLINLDKVIRHGLEIQLSGHLTDDLSFYLGYAYQTFENQGDEPAGETELDNQPENRVSAGLRYHLFENTLLLLDYKYEDEQIIQKSEEIGQDEWRFTEISTDAYHVFDLAVQQTLFKKWGFLNNGILKLYTNNLFDEDYENLSGYPATDQTYGVSLSLKF